MEMVIGKLIFLRFCQTIFVFELHFVNVNELYLWFASNS